MLKRYKSYMSLLFLIINVACTPKQQPDNSTMNNKHAVNNVSNRVSIQVTLSGKEMRGDLTQVSYLIANKPKHPILNGRMQCTQQTVNNQAEEAEVCTTKDSLRNLSVGIYRILILQKKSNGGLFCTTFEYKNEELPLQLNFSPQTSGECILSQLEADTGYTEEEINRRTREIINQEIQQKGNNTAEYLYYLMIQLDNGSESINMVWNNLVNRIISKRPLSETNDVNNASALLIP